MSAEQSGKGRPSGASAILMSYYFSASIFVKNECFLGVKVAKLVAGCCYIPTDNRGLTSEEKFSRAVLKLPKSLQQSNLAYHHVILA